MLATVMTMVVAVVTMMHGGVCRNNGSRQHHQRNSAKDQITNLHDDLLPTRPTFDSKRA